MSYDQRKRQRERRRAEREARTCKACGKVCPHTMALEQHQKGGAKCSRCGLRNIDYDLLRAP